MVNGKINPHEVMVIRYEGPRGSGMPELLMTTEAIRVLIQTFLEKKSCFLRELFKH